MAERGDMTVLHEPFYNLKKFGAADADGRTFNSCASLLAWLRDETHGISVFFKDTTDHRHDDVFADRRFLAEARHAFLIRRLEKIAASFHALSPDMSINTIGLEIMCELRAAVRDAGGDPSAVIDSDDLAARPGATMAAYCAAVGLPFIPRALAWEPGERPEWRRSARWYADVSASNGFVPHERSYPCTVENSGELARLAAHHLPFYERLHAQRLDVTPWEQVAGS